ncbi:hypothetical protein EVAR_28411_1 [Eumeta japonica]|uniref:Uncharacterized protein n=1 Tax=Eumeta variegata TaxID=151549 RepID=A0A4C1V8T1_EUMVA|nr:hypothetical protein EVAR_28411_1 [Eumeta japonica]
MLVLDEGGREAQFKLDTQPTAGGRTLVDADRIKAARIGDPLGVDLTERACRPLIRLSTHPTAAARAVRVSEPRPSPLRSSITHLHSSIFSLQSSIRCLRGPPRARVIANALSGGGAPGCGVVADEGGEGTAQPRTRQRAGVLFSPGPVSVVFRSTRAPKHRRAASDTSASGSAGAAVPVHSALARGGAEPPAF